MEEDKRNVLELTRLQGELRESKKALEKEEKHTKYWRSRYWGFRSRLKLMAIVVVCVFIIMVEATKLWFLASFRF